MYPEHEGGRILGAGALRDCQPGPDDGAVASASRQFFDAAGGWRRCARRRQERHRPVDLGGRRIDAHCPRWLVERGTQGEDRVTLRSGLRRRPRSFVCHASGPAAIDVDPEQRRPAAAVRAHDESRTVPGEDDSMLHRPVAHAQRLTLAAGDIDQPQVTPPWLV